jgi:hypothetical protein
MGKNKNALLFAAIGLELAVNLGVLATRHEDTEAQQKVEAAIGPVALDQQVVIKPVKPFVAHIETTTSTTTVSETEEVAPLDQYTETQIIPQVEAAGLQIVEPINQDVETVNQPGQFIVASNPEYGVQFAVGDAVDPKDPVQTMNISITVFGDLDTLRDGKVEGDAIHDTSEDFRHAEGVLATGCNYDPTKPQDAVTFIQNAEAELTRAITTDTPIQLDKLIQNLPLVSFLDQFSDSIG